MISLGNIENYCEKCKFFKGKATFYSIEEGGYVTRIQCDNSDTCEALLAHIKSEVSKKNEVL